MSDFVVRPAVPADRVQARLVDARAFGATVGDDDTPEPAIDALFEPFGFVALDADAVVGIAAAYPMSITVPGGASLRCPGVTSVAVMPTHRRRGALRRLMTSQLEAMRSDGCVVASLMASETTIYERFGYGRVARNRAVEIDTRRAALRARPDVGGSTELVAPSEALELVADLHDDHRRRYSGMPSRPTSIWKHILDDPESQRRGMSERVHVVHRSDAGVVDGWVSYRTEVNWTPTGAEHRVEVLGPAAASAAVELELWEFLFSLDLVSCITAVRPLDDMLDWSLVDCRAVAATSVADHNWARIIDPVTVLEQRSYSIDGKVVIGFDDPVFEDLSGAYEVDVTRGEAHVSRTDQTPSLRGVACDWASVVFGEVVPSALVAVGRMSVDPDSDVDLAWCDALFTSNERPFSDVNY